MEDKEFFKIDRGRVRATLVSELWVGGGNTTFRVNRQGVFVGATNYTGAPFKIDYSGNAYSGSTTGSQVVLKSTGSLAFFYNSDEKSSIKADTGGSIIYVSDDNHYFRDNSAELARFNSDGLLLPSNKSIIFTAGAKLRDLGSYLKVEGATGGYMDLRVEGNVYPNSDNAHTCGSSDRRWSVGYFEDISVDDLTVNSGGRLVVNDTAEFNGSLTVSGNSGKSTSRDLVTSVWYDSGANKLKYNYRSYTFNKGWLTGEGSENTATAWTL